MMGNSSPCPTTPPEESDHHSEASSSRSRSSSITEQQAMTGDVSPFVKKQERDDVGDSSPSNNNRSRKRKAGEIANETTRNTDATTTITHNKRTDRSASPAAAPNVNTDTAAAAAAAAISARSSSPPPHEGSGVELQEDSAALPKGGIIPDDENSKQPALPLHDDEFTNNSAGSAHSATGKAFNNDTTTTTTSTASVASIISSAAAAAPAAVVATTDLATTDLATSTTTTAAGSQAATSPPPLEAPPAAVVPLSLAPSLAGTAQPKANSTNGNNNNSYENLRWVTVTNDGKLDSMVKLIGLKSLFAKQLPKMPRAYIARLVLDRRHTSLAILSDNPAVAGSDEEIIGGICYRAFADMRFAEIAFCAVNATHQVKGYGTKLMNLLKQTAARAGIEFFITYADNYAIGYFKKQGFTKQITMPKGRYYGLIKDYDGGTPMECYVHPSIDYYNIPALLQAQRDVMLQRVAHTTAQSLTVYPPLLPAAPHTASTGGATGGAVQDAVYGGNGGGGGSIASRANASAHKALTVPGVLEAGWTLQDLLQSAVRGDESRQKSSALKQELLAILRKVEEQQCAWPFREPVDPTEVPDYLDVIANPIDLKTMAVRIRQDNHYKSKQMLFADLILMVNNCKLYNEDGSTYIQCASALEKFVRTMFHDTVNNNNNNNGGGGGGGAS